MNFTAFTGGSASGTVVGGVTVTATGGSFTGTLSLSGTNASSFAISGTNLVTSGTVSNGTYSINIVATMSGVSTFTQAFTIYGSATTTVPDSTNYMPSGSSYQAYLAPFTGNTHTESLLAYNASFPNNSIITFNWPGSNTSIQGYLAIAYGNYEGTEVSVPVTSKKLSAISTLTTTFNLGWSGNTSGFDVVIDLFLTTAAPAYNGASAPLSCEIEVFLHTPSYTESYVNGETQLGTVTVSGITWQVAHNPSGGTSGSDYLFTPTDYRDITVGTIDLLAMFRFLQTCSVPISSSLYYNGHDIGVETMTGAGTLTIGSYSVSYS